VQRLDRARCRRLVGRHFSALDVGDHKGNQNDHDCDHHQKFD
jgi:hypothetical protein